MRFLLGVAFVITDTPSYGHVIKHDAKIVDRNVVAVKVVVGPNRVFLEIP